MTPRHSGGLRLEDLVAHALGRADAETRRRVRAERAASPARAAEHDAWRAIARAVVDDAAARAANPPPVAPLLEAVARPPLRGGPRGGGGLGAPVLAGGLLMLALGGALATRAGGRAPRPPADAPPAAAVAAPRVVRRAPTAVARRARPAAPATAPSAPALLEAVARRAVAAADAAATDGGPAGRSGPDGPEHADGLAAGTPPEAQAPARAAESPRDVQGGAAPPPPMAPSPSPEPAEPVAPASTATPAGGPPPAEDARVTFRLADGRTTLRVHLWALDGGAPWPLEVVDGSVAALPPGRWVFVAHPDDAEPAWIGAGGPSRGALALAPLALGAGAQVTVTWRLAARPLEVERISGRLETPDGAAAAHGVVDAQGTDGEVWSIPVTPEDDGRFTLTLPGGTWQLGARHDPLAPPAWESPIILAPGAPVAGVVIRLP